MANPNTYGRVIWRELHTKDLERAKTFYAELLGWRYRTMPLPDGESGDYTLIELRGGRTIGGMHPAAPQKPVSAWSSYVSVPDVDAAVAAVRAGGGSVLWGPVTAPGIGRLATIRDPEGAVISLMHPEDDSPWAREPLEAGAFCRESLVAADTTGASKFYGAVMDWKDVFGIEGGFFTVGEAGEEDRVADLSSGYGARPSWTTYVVVDDLDLALARATELGARPAVASTSSRDRGARIADPTGAFIGLVQPRR